VLKRGVLSVLSGVKLSHTIVLLDVNKLENKKQIKKLINEVFNEDLHQNELQNKIDFFYGANTIQEAQPHMNFEGKDESFLNQKTPVTKNSHWKNISKNVFTTNDQRFRNFLRTVNKEMYLNLINIGHKY